MANSWNMVKSDLHSLNREEIQRQWAMIIQ